jgi:ribonuclease Y
MSSDWIAGLLLGALLGATAAFWLSRQRNRRNAEAARLKAEIDEKEARLALREERGRMELALERREAEMRQRAAGREGELETRGHEIERKAANLKEELADLARQTAELEARSKLLSGAEHEAEKMRRLYQLKLYQISQMDRTEARKQLLRATEAECEEELRELRTRLLNRSEAAVTDQARRILLAAMQRITGQPMNDATATVVSLPSEELKGRIIGREGRNIRTFEHATGTTLMIDETPDSVLISCFDPVRREVARIALEALVRDGRIHPSSIEEEVAKAEEAMRSNVLQIGEEALRGLRLSGVSPEVVALLGKLHYRLSNNQNTLAHSVEVAHLCALIAAEIGLDPVIAKRAGLFHDIGKAVEEDHEGSHAAAGADIIKRNGEDPRVVNATAAHHEEVPAESAYAPLVMVADALSATRPGARASSLEGFIQRVRSIEDIARSEHGVTEAYALQAGREVRVIVEPEKVGDEEARQIARRVRRRIENELHYPGSIQITVVREQRFTETAV